MRDASPTSLRELDSAAAGLGLDGGWLVGGCVRDALLGRPLLDLDVAVAGDVRGAALAVARRRGGSPFPLSERHGGWRVVGDGWTVDVTPLRGTIEEDLAGRDFTANAIARELAGGELVDPFGGRRDVADRTLRAVSDTVFADDPLRLLRLPRLAHELRFQVERATAELARAQADRAPAAAGERIYAELRRLLACPDPAAGVRWLASLGVLDAVLPELAALRGVEQSPFHHLDVYEHTLHVLDAVAEVADHPEHYLPRHADEVRAALAVPVGDELAVRDALRLAALFHDVAKPAARVVLANGRVGFPGHDRQGADVAQAILERWHAARSVVRFCRVLVAEHLRLGFLIRERPLDRRAAFRYAAATEPYAVASVLLSLADRLATRGSWTRLRSLRRHAETADELLGLHAALAAEERPPLLRGDEIAERTGARGGEIGRLVNALAEEQAAGAVRTREQAIAFVTSS